MTKVRVSLPLVLDLPDATVALARAASPLVRSLIENAPALRALGQSGRAFLKEADKIVAAERTKKRARTRGSKVR